MVICMNKPGWSTEFVLRIRPTTFEKPFEGFLAACYNSALASNLLGDLALLGTLAMRTAGNLRG